MNKNKQPLLWGMLHCLNDFAAGFMLANYTLNHNQQQSFLFIVIYAIIGFGGQLPVGFWIDSQKIIKPFAAASVSLLPAAILFYFISPEAGIICSGFASAFVHVTGGAICLQVHDNKTGPLALFTAPGVLGLTIGGALGSFGAESLLICLALTFIIGYLIFKQQFPFYHSQEKKQSELDGHDWLMLGILLIMCFRSFVFDVLNQVAQEHENGLIIIGISAFAGKIIGGFAADKIGWKRYVYISLPLALLLFQFGKENIYALSFGIASLQSSVPITLMLMRRGLQLYPGTATALSLGTSIALAGLPLFMISGKTTVMDWFGNAWITGTAFILILISGGILIGYMNRVSGFNKFKRLNRFNVPPDRGTLQ